MLNLKEEILLSSEISKYIKLKKSGNLFWGLCPFHHEKTPSFAVNDQKAFFHCFGCGQHGDIFSFTMKHCGLSFKETITKLCKENNLVIPKISENNQKNLYVEIMQQTLQIYEQNLQNNSEALDYLKNRGISSQLIEKFQLGFAEENIDSILKLGFDIDSLKILGICSVNNLDRMRHRIIFPIISRNKEVIGFAGRVLNNSLPKYLNSNDNPLFNKSYHLFNEQNLILNKDIILVEGYIDVISLSPFFDNVVASMGTSLSHGQALTIFRITDRVILMFDGDTAGKKAIMRNLEILLQFVSPEKEIIICELLDNRDPDDLIREQGPEKIKKIIANGLSYHQWFLKHISVADNENPKEVALALEKIDNFLEKVKNKHVKKSLYLFFNKNYFHNKKKETILIPKISNLEDILMAFLLSKPQLLSNYIELLMNFNFTNEEYENLRIKMIDELTFNHTLSENFIAKEISPYDMKIRDIFEKYNLSFIIRDEDFVKKCVSDLIISLRNKKLKSLKHFVGSKNE